MRQSLSGTRCAVSKWAGEDVQLLDFSPGRVRRLEYLVEKKGTEWENLRELLVNSQSTIYAGKYFKHDIVSYLPYFEIRRRGATGQLLIDDQLVVQTQVCLFQFTTEYSTSDLFFNILYFSTIGRSHRAILFGCILFRRELEKSR